MNYRHGMRGSPIYAAWRTMRTRCENENCAAYPNYGGRGITVCEEWKDFSNFYRDMGDRPAGLSLDRIDNEKGYSRDNCRWADRTTQARNQRNMHMLTLNGEEQPLCVWAERSGLSLSTIWARLKNGWDPTVAVFGRKVQRKGVPRGARLRDHQEYAFGAEHGVQWSDTQGMSAFGQDPKGLEAKPASPVGESRCAEKTPINSAA